MKLSILIIIAITCGFFPVKTQAQLKNVSIKSCEKSYKLLDLKNNLLKSGGGKNRDIIKIENTEMSKGSAALLGGGIGLVGGGLIGGVIAGSENDDNPIDEGLGIAGGIVLGGLSGMVTGGIIGYLLGD